MASFKQPCIQCGEFIDRDSRLCPRCATRFPFGYHCPYCQREIQKGYAVCASCGRPLSIACPHCKADTFIGAENCEACGKSLMMECTDKNCKQPQFFDLEKCSACGKPLKKARKEFQKKVK